MIRKLWSWLTGAGSSTVRSLYLFVISLLACYAALAWLQADYPYHSRVVWDYALLWLWQLVLCIACLSFGRVLLIRLFKIHVPWLESWVFSMTLGLISFVLFMYMAGAVGIYGPVFAVSLPVLMSIAGARICYEDVRTRRSQAKTRANILSLTQKVAICFGLAGCLLVYTQSATPDSLLYDAGWTHLTIAEDYAREGRIVPFIGATTKNFAHLSSLIFTWSFILPGLRHPALHWMAAQHTELLLFVWTLIGIAAGVQWVLPKKQTSGAWAALFLFPGIFVYDSNLGAAGDHVAAFFAVPLLLAALRASTDLSLRFVMVTGLISGAALQTKFQCMYLVGPIAVWFVIRWLWLFGSQLWQRYLHKSGALFAQNLLLAPLVFAASSLLSFGPYLIANWIFYRNPVYPFFLDFFPSTPYGPQFTYDATADATATASFAEQFKSSLPLIFTFSFEPNYFALGAVPVFGSLFTLLSPVVIAFFRNRRLWGVFLLSLGSIFMWAIVYRIGRNLQIILPWLVVYTACAIIVTLRSGRLARLGVSLIVGLQVAWGIPLMFADGSARFDQFAKLLKDSVKHKESTSLLYDRFRRKYLEIGRALPKDAVVLLHTAHLHLGINRPTLEDWAGWQFIIDYRAMQTPLDVYNRYKELGVTHIIWNNHDFPSIKQEDVLFFAFVRRHAQALRQVHGTSIWKMPDTPPAKEEAYQVVALGLDGYENGLYPITSLGVIEAAPQAERHFPAPQLSLKDQNEVAAAFVEADAVLVAGNYKLDQQTKSALNRCFKREHSYHGGFRIPNYAVYLRKLKAKCAP